MKIAILGAGAWGTGLAISLAEHHAVALWARNSEHVAAMNRDRENRRYLPGFRLASSVDITDSLETAARDADLVIAVVPTGALRATLSALAAATPVRALLWACKGFETGTRKLPHEIVAEVLPETRRVGVLSGPSFASEVAAGYPTALTLASKDEAFALEMAPQLHSGRLRVYSNTDVIGVEVGGAVKNVMAIAAGISDGLQLGHNARAALITRGLAEFSRLGMALGGRPETFMGLTGAGDLILTCTGDLSRNRRVGLELASGRPLADILQALGHTAEGVSTAREVAQLAGQLGVDMPITQAVCAVLYESLSPRQAVETLLSRGPKPELDPA